MNLFDNKPLQFDTKKKMIRDLVVGERVNTYFRLIRVDKRTKKDGNPFLTMELMDKSGKIPGKAWNNADAIYKSLEIGHIYLVEGLVNEYMNKKEIKVDKMSPANPKDNHFNPADYEEAAQFDIGQTFQQLLSLVKANVTDPHLIKLVDAFAQDYGNVFQRHYGAMKVHHAYLGGLLAHTHSMMKIALFLAEHYGLDKNIILMGVLFHDLGKVYEFNIDPAPQSTLEGGLLGHLVIGVQKFRELVASIPGFPQELSTHIQHLIVSHHGEKEYGSPEVPKTQEAFVLHIIDLLDSKVQIIRESIEKHESNELFSEYNQFLGRRIYIPPEDDKS